MHHRLIAVAASGLLLAGVQALPQPVAEADPQIVVPLPGGGSIIVGEPTSTLIPFVKREAQEELGDVTSSITLGDDADPSAIELTGKKEKRQFELGEPTSTITWDDGSSGSSTFEWTGKKEKRQIGLGDPTSTTTLDDGSSGSSTFEWTGKKEKRQIGLGDPTSTLIWTGKEKREAEPQISLGTPTGTLIWDTPTPSPCACTVGTIPGKYCGYCDVVSGSWVSWNAYRCYSSGACKDLGFSKSCVDGTPKQCPSILFT